MTVIEKYLCIFYIYAFLGWCMETFGGWIKTKKFVNRGFLIGPYIPVYGFGLVILTMALEKYINDFLVLFCMSIILCGILEYFTSWIMEKLFKARWWDYHNRKYNINGRICLETLLPFGIAGSVLLKFVNPTLLRVLGKIPNNILMVTLIILYCIFIIDVIVSIVVIGNLRKTAKKVENELVKDNTEEISNKVKEITTEKAKELATNVSDKIEEAKNNLKISEAEIKKRKDITINIIKDSVQKSQEKIKYKAQNIKNEIKSKITIMTTKEFTDVVKEKYLTKSWLNRRLAKAFPNLQLKTKKLRLKDKND